MKSIIILVCKFKMISDPYRVIQEECFISASQEELLATIPGWEDDRSNQGVIYEFTPSQPLSDDSPATKTSLRSRSSDDARVSGEGVSGVFAGQQPVVWLSPSDTQDAQPRLEDDSFKNTFESDRSQSPGAVSSVILAASRRELLFLDASVQPFTQPPLALDTPQLDTEIHTYDADDSVPSHVEGLQSQPILSVQHNANLEEPSHAIVDFSSDIASLKEGLPGSPSLPKAVCVDSPKSSPTQSVGEGRRSLSPTSCKGETGKVNFRQDQSKKDQWLVLSRVICSPHKVTTKELLAAVEELQEEDDESQEAHEARLFSASSQVPIVPAALLSAFVKSGHQEALLHSPPKDQSSHQISIHNACESEGTDRMDELNAETPRDDPIFETVSTIELPDFPVLDSITAKEADFTSQSILQTSISSEKDVDDRPTTFTKRTVETLEQVSFGIAKKKAGETARCESVHLFPKTVMDVVRFDSESDEECATGYDFLKCFLNAGLSLPLHFTTRHMFDP